MFPPSEQGFPTLFRFFRLFRLLLSVSRVFRPQRAGTIGNRRGFRFRQFSSSPPERGTRSDPPTLSQRTQGATFACAARTGEVWHITAAPFFRSRTLGVRRFVFSFFFSFPFADRRAFLSAPRHASRLRLAPLRLRRVAPLSRATPVASRRAFVSRRPCCVPPSPRVALVSQYSHSTQSPLLTHVLFLLFFSRSC